jgi:hypothetical protein
VPVLNIDLDAPIVPGQSAAGLIIGSDVTPVLGGAQADNVENLAGITVYDFGPVRVWCSGMTIDQVGVRAGYRGYLNGSIRIGDSVSDVERLFCRQVQEDDEDNLVVPEFPGWCFETEIWAKDQQLGSNRTARPC